MTNMKLLLVTLAVPLCVFVSSNDVPITKKQKDVLLLLSHINQPADYPEWKEIVNSWDISKNHSIYFKSETIEQFNLYEVYGWLPKGQIFSVMNQYHLNQSIVLFELFYYAKTYEVFFNTSVWARDYLNEGMFLYTYSLAVVHRPDMQDVILPPIYEIYPHYFYNMNSMQQAYELKQIHSIGRDVSSGNHTIWANYSDSYVNTHPEKSMFYYLEDIGINSYYYYYNLYYPFWMDSKEYGWSFINRGEQYFFFYQQLIIRYYLERLANGLGKIRLFNWETPIEAPYDSPLMYPNGAKFPSRPSFLNLQMNLYKFVETWSWRSKYGYSSTLIQDWERRISDAIDSGVLHAHRRNFNFYDSSLNYHRIQIHNGLMSAYDSDALDTIGNLIQGSPDSPNSQFYGMIWLYARYILGYSYQTPDVDSIVPSSLEHFETSLRDPVFYQLHKKILMLYYKYLYKRPWYNIKDLTFPGVKLVNVQFEKLITYDELFYTDISQAFYDISDENLSHPFRIKAALTRLNHKPFNFKITVKSEEAVKAVVKVFMAPVVDENQRYINLSQNFINTMLVDYFISDLKTGKNVISRNSEESHLYGRDPLSYQEIYQRVVEAENGKAKWSADQYYWRFPQRYMLPHGSATGTPIQFFVVVYEYVPVKIPTGNTIVYEGFFHPFVKGEQIFDKLPLMWPFDRPIYYDSLWKSVPNFYSHETKIYHEKKINIVI